mgnify:CR=1 FL=1
MRMKPFTSHTLALALCCAMASTGWAQTAKPGQPIVLNFVNADIEAVHTICPPSPCARMRGSTVTMPAVQHHTFV